MAVTTKSGARLFLRALGSTVVRLVAGSEGASNPFWSPDSRSLGFFAAGKMKRIAVDGGAPQTICDVPIAPWVIATWGANGDDSVYGLREARRVPRCSKRWHARPGRRAGGAHDVVSMAVVSPRRPPLLVLCATHQPAGGSPSRFPRLLRIEGGSAGLLSSGSRGRPGSCSSFERARSWRRRSILRH